MALIYVNGTVEGTFFDGKGARVKETFKKRDGSEGASYYSVFFEEPHGLNVGDFGKFSGLHSAKAEEFDGKWFARTTLNSARVTDVEYGEGPADDDEAPF